MKIKKIEFGNHVHFGNLLCEFNGSYTEIIGLNGKGKSTIIESIWMALEGLSKKDRGQFIGSKGRAMDVSLTVVDSTVGAEIKIKRHITATSNNKLTFEAPDGYQLSPEWVEDLLSVALFSAKNFSRMSKKDQALALGINTAEYDQKLKELKAEYTVINKQLTSMVEPEAVEKCESVDILSLIDEKDIVSKEWDKQLAVNQKHNQELRNQYADDCRKIQTDNRKYNDLQMANLSVVDRAKDYLLGLEKIGYTGDEVLDFIKGLPQPKELKDVQELAPSPEYIEEVPDKATLNAVDLKISNAYSANQKADQYTKYLKALEDWEQKKEELQANIDSQNKVKAERLEYIKSYKLSFEGLTIDEDGGLLLNEREIKEPYYSSGQLIKIVLGLRAAIGDTLKTVFIDDFDLLDEEHQKSIPEELIADGFQVIVAKVGRSNGGENIISLSPIDEGKTSTKKRLI